MEGSKRREEVCPQLLDLISKDREWLRSSREKSRQGSCSDERKLELRLGLGPPGENWSSLKDNINCRERVAGGGDQDQSHLALGYGNRTTTPWAAGGGKTTSFLHQGKNNAEKNKAYSSAPTPAITAVPNTSSQKRTAPAPVVGWPPIRSFRKNLASTSSSKPATESENLVHNNKINTITGNKPVETCGKGLFVKINMDGVPIGRKVDLKAYDSYDKLSSAVDELFRGLLAAQRDSSAGRIQIKQEEERAITGLLDGSGEYTLVYEDNEGDKLLVGDVPWHMFVSTVKRLRVLKSSELSALSLVSGKQDQMRLDSSSK